jgi:hypothetical protein
MTPVKLDERTPRAKQLVAMAYSTMNLDLHELIVAGVIHREAGNIKA